MTSFVWQGWFVPAPTWPEGQESLELFVLSIATEVGKQMLEPGVVREDRNVCRLQVKHVEHGNLGERRRSEQRAEIGQALHRLEPDAMQVGEPGEIRQGGDLLERL